MCFAFFSWYLKWKSLTSDVNGPFERLVDCGEPRPAAGILRPGRDVGDGFCRVHVVRRRVIWVNYNDLTRPHPKWWFMWEIAPKPPYFRLVKYYDSPRVMPSRPVKRPPPPPQHHHHHHRHHSSSFVTTSSWVSSLPLTWHLKGGPSKRSLIFQVPSHRCHVSWREECQTLTPGKPCVRETP